MAGASFVPAAYLNSNTSTNTPLWLNKGDNAWQMMSATLVGMQGMPGLVILYAGLVKKKWALNSAFMALYAFAAVMPCWILWAYKMSFGHRVLPFWGKPGLATSQDFLITQATLPATYYHHGSVETSAAQLMFPMATMVFFQYAFAAVTVILLAGSVLARMSIRAWMVFVPIWITFSYSIGAFSIWGGGFLFQWGVMDYSGILWMGWSGFNGGDPFAANVDSSMAVLNTHICTATSLLMWTCLDMFFFKKPSIIGAIQGMITGLVCITPAAGMTH